MTCIKIRAFCCQWRRKPNQYIACANVAWNTEMSEKVYGWTGKYPAINCFDYVHLPASVAGADWINYGDITPVFTLAAPLSGVEDTNTGVSTAGIS